MFTWDQDRFPQLETMIDQLHKSGFKVIAIVDPGIKVDPEYDAYKSGIEQDVFLKYPDGIRASAAVWPGRCHFPDFTKPDAREWWKAECQKLLQTGIDGLWNDMCEPATFVPGDSGSDTPRYCLACQRWRSSTASQYIWDANGSINAGSLENTATVETAC